MSDSLGQVLDLKKAKGEAPVAQYSSFSVAGRLYGIDVKCVQEVVKAMPMTQIPLAPPHIVGLINLRGQVATAVGLRQLFALEIRDSAQMMNVVCKVGGVLLSFLADDIGDVVEVRLSDYERTPSTIDERTRRFLGGIYKVNDKLLSVIDVEAIARFLGLSGKQADVAL